jgi:hypothetical protein
MEEKIELTYISLNKDFYDCEFNNNWRKKWSVFKVFHRYP